MFASYGYTDVRTHRYIPTCIGILPSTILTNDNQRGSSTETHMDTHVSSDDETHGILLGTRKYGTEIFLIQEKLI